MDDGYLTRHAVKLARDKTISMDRGQLIDLTRRAMKVVREKTTDLAHSEYVVDAREYTSIERHERDKAMLMASPHLVGYVSELPQPGAYCTKTVMGRSILLTRTSGGTVKAFNNVCLHRQSPVVTGCGTAKRFSCPYHAWTYDNAGRLVGVPSADSFPGVNLKSDGLTELPAAEFAGFLWVALDPGATLDISAHLGPLGGELDSWGIEQWSSVGEKVLDCPINWKLALDTPAENYHVATVHPETFAKIAYSNCTGFDSFGPHHRMIWPLNSILELENVPEDQWDPLQKMMVMYALFPNIVLTLTTVSLDLFRIYPGDGPGRSITVHQNSTPLDLSDESAAAGAQAVFEYAHAPLRDEDYPVVERVQANLESGACDRLLFGRNEPGLQHRHMVWDEALAKRSLLADTADV
jgi:phenylpropionate dioxygenase-like ring-hydroxylating dioxygenase large terminal subunit